MLDGVDCQSNRPQRTFISGGMSWPSKQSDGLVPLYSKKTELRVRHTVTRLSPAGEPLDCPGKGASVKRQVRPTWGLALSAESLLANYEEGNVLWVKPLSGLSKKHGTENCILGCVNVTVGWS